MADETSASSAFSPLSGGYLLIVLSEPHSEQHKQVLLEHLAKGLASWDSVGTQIDIESELRNITTQCPNGEEVRNGEKLIQLASDSLVTEILIQPQLSTLKQCMRNLLASFTRHRHVIHAGYTLSGPGSWILQDGTYEFSDFANIVRDAEIQRIYRAYESSITMDLHCADEGQWSAEQINRDPAIKAAKISINPAGRLSATDSQGTQDAVNSFIRYISDVLPSVTLDHLLEPSDVVGNIRFNHPTLYVFPGGQGDSALFGISGFNILVDGGFGRKPCFWDFTRHLDRLDAVVMTRMNASSLSGLTGAICRKASSPVYPQMGHIFCNLPCDSEIGLGDIDQQLNAADSSSESLNVNINDLCRAMSAGLGALQLKAQPIYRSATLEPINLYHKVGHGTLDMFIISPSVNSPEVKELMRLWRSGEVATALRTVKMGGKEFNLPLLDIVSVCALLVWQPADPNESVTRLLFPGSAPQHKILEGLDKFKQLEFLKSPVFMAKDVAAPPSAVITPSSTSSAFSKSPVKTKTSSPRHTPIEPVAVKAAPVRKEASKPPVKAAEHSSNTKDADAKSATPRPTKVIKADVLSSSSRTGSTELRAKKAEAKPATAPIKSTTTAKKDGPTGLSNGETNKALAPKIKKDVANMKMVEARVHSFKSPASLKRAEENKNKKPTDDKEIKTVAQRSQSQSREKRSASSVRGLPADEEKPRVKLVKKIAASTAEATGPASPAKAAKPIKAKAKELTKPIEAKAPVTKDVKKDKPSTATPRTKPIAAKETSSKPAPKAPAPQSSTPTPSGKAVKRPVKTAAAVVGAAAAVVAVAAVVSEEKAPTAEEQPAVVEEDFSAAEAPEAASSPQNVEAPTDDQIPDEASVIDAIESQIVEDVEATEEQSHHESEPESQSVNLEDDVETEEKEEIETEDKDEDPVEDSIGGEVVDQEESEATEKEEVVEAEEDDVAQLEEGTDEAATSEETEVAEAAVLEEEAETEEADATEKEKTEVVEMEEAEVVDTEDAEVVETEDAEVVETEGAEVVETEDAEVAEIAETADAEMAKADEAEDADVTKTEDAEITEAEDVDVEVKDEVEAVDEISEPQEETATIDVKEETDDEEKVVHDTAEPEETVEPEGENADEHPEKADVKETEQEEHGDVMDAEIANETESENGRSIDNEVVADVAHVDRSSDQDVNLETDECQEPVEEESQLAVSSKSVDAGQPSASPQPMTSEEEMASREVEVDDVIDQGEQSQDLECVHPTSDEQVNEKEELQQPEKEIEKEEEHLSQIHDENVSLSSECQEAVEEEIQPAVSSTSVESSRPAASAQPEILDSDKEVQLQDVDEEVEVHTTEALREGSPLQCEKDEEKEDEKENIKEDEKEDEIEDEKEDEKEEKKEEDKAEFKTPVAIGCQLYGNGDNAVTINFTENEQVENAISGQVDEDVIHEGDHVDSHHIEKRQTQELAVEVVSHHDDAPSSLSSLSDLEPTPVLDQSGASLCEEEQLSSMESQPESHHFTQKSAPLTVEQSPKDSKAAKAPESIVLDESNDPSSLEEVEEEFKAEIVVRPVPVLDTSDLAEIVTPQQPTPTPPVVKSPVKEIPSALVLDQEEDEGEEVEEEAFQKEIKTKDCAVPITPTEEDHALSAFGYSEPERQREDHQLSSSIPTSSDVTGKKEELTTDGCISQPLSHTKEAETDEFRATIDDQYAGFINVETSFKEVDDKPESKLPEETLLKEKLVEHKMVEENILVDKVTEKTLPEEKSPSPIDMKEDHFDAVEEKKCEEAVVAKSMTDVKPVEKVEEPHEEVPVVEEVVSKVVENKSVKAEKLEDCDVQKMSETKPVDESDILKLVEDIIVETVEVPLVLEKSVNVAAEPKVEKLEVSEHLVESSQVLEVKSTQATQEIESPKSDETFVVEDVRSFIEDIHTLVEEIQLSKTEVKSVESDKKEVLEESKEALKFEEPKFASNTETSSIHDVQKEDIKDSVTNAVIETLDVAATKADDFKVPATSEKEETFDIVDEVIAAKVADIPETVKSPVEDIFEKVSAIAVSKMTEKENCDVEDVTEKVAVVELPKMEIELPKMEEKEEKVVEEIIEKASSIQVSKTPEKAESPVEEIIEKASAINVSVEMPKVTEKEMSFFDKIIEKVAAVVDLPKMSGKEVAEEENVVEEIMEKVSSAQVSKTPEKNLSFVEEINEKISPVPATPKSDETISNETEVFGKIAEKLEDLESVVFEKCEKYVKIEEDILPTINDPIQHATTEASVFSADVKSQRSSTSETIPLELEFEISERKLSDVSASVIGLVQKDQLTEATLLQTEVKITSTSESSKDNVVADAPFVAPFTASSPIDGPELLKELTFPLGFSAKAEVDVLPKDEVEEVEEFIKEVKQTSVEMASKSESIFESKAKEVTELIQDAKEVSVEFTSECESVISHEIKTEAEKMVHDVKVTSIELTTKSDTESSWKSVEEVKEIVHSAKDVSIELALKSEVDYSHENKTEEVKEIIQVTKDVPVELASKSDIDVSHQTKVEEIREIVQEIESVTLQLVTKSGTDCSPKSKVDEIKEEIQEIKKVSTELASKTDFSSDIQEEVQEIVQDVKKATVELASKSVADNKSNSKMEEVCDIIETIQELPSTISKVTEIVETKAETIVESKAVPSEPEVIPQATFQLKCDPLASLPVIDLVEPSKIVSEEPAKSKSSDLAKLDIVDKTEQLKPEAMDYATVSGSSSTSVTPKTPLSPNIARREVMESKVSPSVSTLESLASPPTHFEDEAKDQSQPSSLDSVEVHSTSSGTWAAMEQHQEEDEDVGSVSLTPTINYLAAGYDGVNISTSSKLSTIASSDGEAEAAQPPSLDSNWSSKTFDKLTLAADARHQTEESAFSSGPSSWDEREPNTRPYYVVSESISDRSATSSIISHVTDDDYPAEKQDRRQDPRPSLVSHMEPRTSSELSNKKELGALPVSPVPSSPFSTDRCSSQGDFEANKDSLSSIQTSESSDYHLETKVDDSHSAISSTRSDYSDDRSNSSIDPSLLQQQRLEERSVTPRSDISCSSDATDPITTANTITSTTELIQPGQQQTAVEMKASSKAELADPKLAPHNVWLKEKDTASSPNPFTDQYVDDDTDHPESLEHASSALYYPQQKEQPHQQQHLSDFESDRHSDSQSSSVPVAEYTDEYYAQQLEFVEASQKSTQPHTDEVSDPEAYLYESEHDDHDQHFHPYATKYNDSYDEADLYPTEEAINDDYRHVGDHQNGNSYHYYESSDRDSTEANVAGHPHHQYEDQNRNDRTPTRDVQLPYAAADVYGTEPAVYSPTSRPADVAAPMTASSSRDERVVPQASPLPSPQPEQALQTTQQKHEDTLASWGKPLGLPAPVAPGVVFSSNGSNGSPLKRTATASNNANKSAEKATNGTNSIMGAAPFYVDLAYIPHHSDPRYSDVEFFKRVRARHYVLSTLEPSTQVLDALLEGKQSWTGDDKDLDVTIIPTYDSDALAVWVSANEDVLARNRIDLAPSASRCTINLQDHETSCSAYRLEF